MPLPTGLVVKKGSKAWLTVSVAIPTPVSEMQMATYCPVRTSAWFAA